MKKCRKILSIILMLSMVMQLLPVFAAETNEATPAPEISYLLYDEFGADDTDEWTAKARTGEPQNGVTTALVEGSTDNYMLTYTASSNFAIEHLSKTLETPAQISPDRDVVIETRMKYSGSASVYMKYNLAGRCSNTDELSSGWGILFRNANGGILLANGWTPTSGSSYQYYNGQMDTGAANLVLT